MYYSGVMPELLSEGGDSNQEGCTKYECGASKLSVDIFAS